LKIRNQLVSTQAAFLRKTVIIFCRSLKNFYGQSKIKGTVGTSCLCLALRLSTQRSFQLKGTTFRQTLFGDTVPLKGKFLEIVFFIAQISLKLYVKCKNSKFDKHTSSVADPDRFGPDPDPISENRPDPDSVKTGSRSGFI
jgi:hypothetical protein